MGSIPLALSIHHFISSVGADAGFASILGLAVLILLYFAQARETASLRAHAQEAAERIQDLEARLRQLGRVQAVPAPTAAVPASAGPVPASAGPTATRTHAPAATPTFAAIPIAPAGVGAPAL